MTVPEYQFGAQYTGTSTKFRVWAPGNNVVAVDVEDHGSIPVKHDADGWASASVSCKPGARYLFRLEDGRRVPDPASRWQPDGVHGHSVVTDAGTYAWRCTSWRGRPWSAAVIYELHVGLCGGYTGAAARLQELVDLGITAVEFMPLAEFPGGRNWGYDGVLPYAPESAYGTPDELKALVDQAHALGLMVFLDVVYNHFGPDGNWISTYAPQFFRTDKTTPWGAAIDFREEAVSRYFIENALYWLHEFRFDGLRFDAVHTIVEQDWLNNLAGAIRASIPADRHVHLILENESNRADLLENVFTAQWNDDFHNAMHVLLTGETHSYYRDFAEDTIEKLARCLAEGFVYQGQPSVHKPGRKRGMPSGHLPPTAFVSFLQNHDQVGNRAFGERLTTLVAHPRLKAAIGLQLLCPQIPMIFMGEEIGSREPFLFFTDFQGELARAVRDGRRKEFAGGAGFADERAAAAIPDPNARGTFEASIPHSPPQPAEDWRGFYRHLLACRRKWLGDKLEYARSLGAAVIGPKAVLARWQLSNGTVLTIGTNLDEAPIMATLPRSQPIWGEKPGDRLPAATTTAWIDTDG
jgi:malto-oligosyltrehalose trehalohydrolase